MIGDEVVMSQDHHQGVELHPQTMTTIATMPRNNTDQDNQSLDPPTSKKERKKLTTDPATTIAGITPDISADATRMNAVMIAMRVSSTASKKSGTNINTGTGIETTRGIGGTETIRDLGQRTGTMRAEAVTETETGIVTLSKD